MLEFIVFLSISPLPFFIPNSGYSPKQIQKYRHYIMKKALLISTAAITATLALFLGMIQPAFALVWNWNYSSTGVNASGTFTTDDTPNSSGFYRITGITGTRNGETITSLQPVGTSMPGNEPYMVDNLISLKPQQLTGEGFGYSTVRGNYVNLFFADFVSPVGCVEVLSVPPFISGTLGPEDSELPISFSTTPITVPKSSSNFGFLVLGILSAASIVKRQLKLSQLKNKRYLIKDHNHD